MKHINQDLRHKALCSKIFKTIFTSKLLNKFEASLLHGPDPASVFLEGKLIMPFWNCDFV